MDFPAFELARLPRIVFGEGALNKVPALAARFGRRALLVTGARSFRESSFWASFADAMKAQGCDIEIFAVAGEPSPQLVDEAAAQFRDAGIDAVIGIGGGSVLDAAKAVAGLLRVPNSVMDYLEGVGPELPYQGPAVPFIAVPTTAGTGSEATRNAVLSVQGEHGFKKSFRHESLVPQYAVLDPRLLATCPRPQIAANGMDALTQLLESYVSLKANPFTDRLAISGIRAVRDGLFEWLDDTPHAAAGRAAMAYAALLSGIALAQVGLGSVHGLAAPLGAFFPIPHGVACGTLVAVCSETNLRALMQRAPDSPALGKYAEVGRVLTQRRSLADEDARAALRELLSSWTRRLDLPRLSAYGMTATDIPRVVANCRGNSMKTNPVVLTDEEVAEILRLRL
ncbi:MAG TPA: iron-containing alcohol dehydrogenase [Novimethylophilus sp.]|jgi:alcohol dehydrogenase|uniref:iron-containing alcohol dehydrogenase n=1 Tax=Novimethylophilus sp. TaxID=2137426 RepID=UPI002F3EE3F6